jgi:quercetin dioxygenase-like cupin family protein
VSHDGVAGENLDRPDEVRTFADASTFEALALDGVSVGRMTLKPGWRWSVHNKPLVGGESCASRHLGYVLSGRLAFRMDDGTTAEAGPGSLVEAAPGHDAWVVGGEPCVMIDFGGVYSASAPEPAAALAR